jgi:drug/metabolite transporter (DMT)-like permease
VKTPNPQKETYSNRPLTGALYVLGASFVFSILGALVKVVSSTLNNEMVVFFRNVWALVFILPWIWYSRLPGGVRTNCFKLHLFRSVAGLGAMYCFFYAIAMLQLSEAFLLIATAPLFIPIVAYMWMREPITSYVRGAIIIGFIGIVLILKPGLGLFQPVSLVGLGAGVLAALAMVSIRRMSSSEPAIRIVFYFTVLSTVISVISAGPLFWTWQSPASEVWWLLILIGLLAAVGQFFLTKGYSVAPAAQVGPITYSNIVFAVMIGWLFWEETLDILTWSGAFFIFISGIITTRKTETHVLVGGTVGTAVKE